MNCILIIACLVGGFLLGRMGCNAYDGLFVLGSNPEDYQIMLALDAEELPRSRYIMLKIVNETGGTQNEQEE